MCAVLCNEEKKMTMNLLIVEKVVTFPQIRFVVSSQKKLSCG